jgi:hypothetical protein
VQRGDAPPQQVELEMDNPFAGLADKIPGGKMADKAVEKTSR